MYLNRFIDNTVDDTQRLEVESNAIQLTGLDPFILLAEMVEELRS